MGLNLKWVFSVQSPLSLNPPSSSSSPSHSFRGKDAFFEMARVSFPSLIPVKSDYPVRARTCSSTSLTWENDYLESNEIKTTIGKSSGKALYTMMDNHLQMTSGDGTLTFLTSLQPRNTLQFSLLLENLDTLEDTFSDSDAVELERGILVQLERLGALNLFHTFLSRNLKFPTFPDFYGEPAVLIEETSLSAPTEDHMTEIVVRTKKKEERKARRRRALDKASEMCTVKYTSSSRLSSNSRGRRRKITRNEAELTSGVKMIAGLERLKMRLEKLNGGVVSLRYLAAVARIDRKVLQEKLHFGISCKDDLLRSTRSLVNYIARSYSRQGVGFEDLIQGIIEPKEIHDTGGKKEPTEDIIVAIRSGKTLDSCGPKHFKAVHDVLTTSLNRPPLTSFPHVSSAKLILMQLTLKLYRCLFNAGNIGVLQGAERFDHTMGYKFSTYVHHWIRKSMSACLAQNAGGIRIPMAINRRINKIQKARKTLRTRLGKHPDDNEIAKFTGLSLAKVASASQCLRVVGSIDQKIYPGSSTTFLEVMHDTRETPEEAVLQQHMINDVHHLLNGLDPRQGEVLALKYGLGGQRGLSLAEIGRKFNVSREWTRKLERKALTKLRKDNTLQDLRHYLYL